MWIQGNSTLIACGQNAPSCYPLNWEICFCGAEALCVTIIKIIVYNTWNLLSVLLCIRPQGTAQKPNTGVLNYFFLWATQCRRQFKDRCLRAKWSPLSYVFLCILELTKGQTSVVCWPDLAHGPPFEKAWPNSNNIQNNIIKTRANICKLYTL